MGQDWETYGRMPKFVNFGSNQSNCWKIGQISMSQKYERGPNKYPYRFKSSGIDGTNIPTNLDRGKDTNINTNYIFIYFFFSSSFPFLYLEIF